MMKFAIWGWAVLFSAMGTQASARNDETATSVCTAADIHDPACRRSEALEQAVEQHLADEEIGNALRDLAELIFLRSSSLGNEDPATREVLRKYADILGKIRQPIDREPKYIELLHLMRSTLGKSDPDTIQALADYAVTLSQLDRYSEAEPLFADVLNYRREAVGERDPKTILSLAQYAEILGLVDRSVEAEPLSAKALGLSLEELGERNPTTIDVMAIRAKVLQRQGFRQWAEAYPLMKEALSLSQEVRGKRHPQSIKLFFEYIEMSEFAHSSEEKAALFMEASDLSRDVMGSGHPDRLKAMMTYVMAAITSDGAQDALGIARDAANAWRARSQELRLEGIRGGEQGVREFGYRQFYEGVFADLLWDYLKNDAGDFEAMSAEAFTALQYASSNSNSRAVTEAAALRFSDRVGLRSFVEERQALIREWSDIEAQLVASQSFEDSLQDRQHALQTRLIAVERRVAQIDQSLLAIAPEYFAILNQPAAELDKVRQIIGADEAALLLVPGFLGWHSMAIDKENIAWNFKLDLGSKPYAERILEFRGGMEIGASGELPVFDFGLAYKLYRDLIEPVEQPLEGKKRVYVVADGALSRLPLGTLLTSRLGPADRMSAGTPAQTPSSALYVDQTDDFLRADWLADRYALVQLPSLQSLDYIRSFAVERDKVGGVGFEGFGAPVLSGNARLRGARSATLDAVEAAGLVGEARGISGMPLMNPEALRQLVSLPGTTTELEQVRKSLGAPEEALHLAERMTEPSIRSVDLSNTRILHLATHGFTSEESGETAEPGLVFTPPSEAKPEDDGYLAASEVVGLNLTRAEWVILSACNTASPSGRPGESGLSGLAQAFFYAGTESLLVSHWPVFDDIAPLLTVGTLKRSEAGQPRAEALQTTMREIRNDRALDAAHPAIWAPFTLVGEGR